MTTVCRVLRQPCAACCGSRVSRAAHALDAEMHWPCGQRKDSRAGRGNDNRMSFPGLPGILWLRQQPTPHQGHGDDNS
jgi:hypothetical protein